VEFIADALREAPAVIAAIGPLTNIGLLAHHHPDVMSRIEQLVVVAGRSEGANFYIGDKGLFGDFNFENDPRSFELVLRTKVPVVLAGFELTSQVCVTRDDLQEIAARGTDAAKYFHRNSLAWCQYWTDTFPADAGFHPWDSATIAWLRHPEYFSGEPRDWEILQNEKGKPLLVCKPGSANPRVNYLHGFASGGKEAFVADVVTTVY
jgi:inosine-uridine nucleoside N-ribohydrolase